MAKTLTKDFTLADLSIWFGVYAVIGGVAINGAIGAIGAIIGVVAMCIGWVGMTRCKQEVKTDAK